ncbi:glycoside hydrolase family 95-like protein [Schleiferilactobacillus harbinensis]|uniref:glycoside hydrolase family 95-like protein n=1 Tax=Schleiferilactobacillus harbinensis TaxID=304207 RepID=UPI0035CEFDFC
MQYDDGQLDLLPALPEAWPDGQLTGVRIPGKNQLDIIWHAGCLKKVKLTGPLSNDTRVRINNQTVTTIKHLIQKGVVVRTS